MSSGETLGATVAASAVFTDLAKRFPTGRPGGFRSDAVEVPGGLRTIITSSDGSAGDVVPPDHRGILEPGVVRPLTLRQLLTIIPTQTDSVEYAAETGRVSAAAPVAEATAITGTSGTKPEGGLTFTLETAEVRTIAVWVGATRRILSDAPGFRAYVDEYLSSDIALEVEDQVLSGTGTGENFTGIFNTTGTNTAGPPGAGESMIHVIREGIRLVQVNGRTNPTAIVVHPADAETLDLLQVNSEANHFVSSPFAAGPRVLFGVPVVVTDANPQGFALVGDFRKAVLFDREQVTIASGPSTMTSRGTSSGCSAKPARRSACCDRQRSRRWTWRHDRAGSRSRIRRGSLLRLGPAPIVSGRASFVPRAGDLRTRPGPDASNEPGTRWRLSSSGGTSGVVGHLRQPRPQREPARPRRR